MLAAPKKAYNSTARRWYVCECGDRSCREEFYMSIREYQAHARVPNAMLVVSGHAPKGYVKIRVAEGVFLARPRDRRRGK